MSDATQSRTVLSNLVDRRYEDELGYGDTIHITDASNPAVRMKSADTLATYSNITENVQDIAITRHAYCGFLIEKIAEKQARVDLRAMYTNKTGYSLTSFIEGDATSGMVSLGSGFSQSVGTLGQDPTQDQIIRAVQYLDDGDVDEDGRFFAVTPALHAALLKMDVFTHADYVGSSDAQTAIKRAKVGMVYNAPVYKTSLLNANPAAAAQGYGWFCHKDGVALIVQSEPEVNAQWDLLNFGWGVMVDTFYNFDERHIAPSARGGGASDDRFNVAVCGA